MRFCHRVSISCLVVSGFCVGTLGERLGSARTSAAELAPPSAGGAATSALAELTDVAIPPPRRAKAVVEARRQAEGDALSLDTVRRTFKDIVWSAQEASEVRLAILISLINDTDATLAADGRLITRLMLPRESRPEIVKYLCKAAADRGWTDAVPSLIRSYSRTLGTVKEADRPERAALLKLTNNRAIAETVFEHFVKPPEGLEELGKDWPAKFRRDAWELLGRLDADGSKRLALTGEGGSGLVAASGDPVIAALRACATELHAVPATGGELDWLVSLRDAGRPENASWWQEASAAMEKAWVNSGKASFSLRHAEAVRWTAARVPERLGKSRAELLAELHRRLDGRQIRVRTKENVPGDPKIREKLDQVQDTLGWADLVVILALEQIIREPGMVRTMFQQAELDRRDESTEYGGLIVAPSAGKEGDAPFGYVARLFPPQAGQRQSDTSFVASDDLIRSSDRALAQYHFHVQKVRNSEFAGPSPEDRAFASKFGRNCLVLTSVNTEELNVDYYHAGDVVLDLGTIQVGKQ